MNEIVALVNSNQVKPAVAPIAFDYLYEPLVRAGFRPLLLDLCFADDVPGEIARFCRRNPPHFWGVTLRNTDDVYFSSQESFLPKVRAVVQALRRQRDVPIVLGGVGFSVMPKTILEYCGADFGIVCEGEVSFPLLLQRLSRGEPYGDISGLVYRSATGIEQNPVAFADLAAVGAHRREFVDNSLYFARGGLAAVETKRGCGRVCIYCVEPLVKGRTVRLRAPADIADEIESLVERGISAIHINDSEFNLNVPHALAFMAELRRRGLHTRFQWYAYGMPFPFTEELASAMKASGCAGMNFGTDSASPKMLRVLRRTFRAKHITEAVRLCRRYDLRHIIEILFGAPGETEDTVRETVDFLKDLDPERVSITAGLRVFPGTELEAIVRAEGISRANPNLFGAIDDNPLLLKPLFYLSAQIGADPLATIAKLIGDDPRFFGVNTDAFNYNANQILVDEIARGERGAYWAILSRFVDRQAQPGCASRAAHGVALAERELPYAMPAGC